MNSAVISVDVKKLKFRAATSGISRRGVAKLIHLGRLVCHVSEFCM